VSPGRERALIRPQDGQEGSIANFDRFADQQAGGNLAHIRKCTIEASNDLGAQLSRFAKGSGQGNAMVRQPMAVSQSSAYLRCSPKTAAWSSAGRIMAGFRDG
jgi:hypothetical protein